MFPTAAFPAPGLFQPGSCRGCRIGPAGCGIAVAVAGIRRTICLDVGEGKSSRLFLFLFHLGAKGVSGFDPCFLSVCMYICTSVCLSFCLSCLFVCLIFCLFDCISFCLSVLLSVFLPVCLYFVFPSVCLSVCLHFLSHFPFSLPRVPCLPLLNKAGAGERIGNPQEAC